MNSLKDYPYWSAETLEDARAQLRQITHLRKDDIVQWNSLTGIFVMGRKVGKVPTGSADVTNGDKINDVNWDADYLYILVDDSGTGAWRRVGISSW